jgi:hypothetical protein
LEGAKSRLSFLWPMPLVWSGGILEWWNGGKCREIGLRMNRRKEHMERKERKMPNASGVSRFSAAIQ